MPLNDNLDLDPATAEATGLAPGASDVTSIEPHDVDPSYSVVTYADQRQETMPTSEAKKLPFVPPAAAPMGPPPPPVGGGADPGFALSPEQQAATSAAPENTLAFGGAGGSPAPVTAPAFGQMQPTAGGDLGGDLPPPEVDPSAPVDPGAYGASGTADTTTDSLSETTNNTVGDPNQVAQDVAAGYSDTADQLDAQARGEQVAKSVENQTLLDQQAAQQAKLEDDLHKAEIHRQEAQKVVEAVEATPIEEDFYKGAPGRQVAAWVALALSGFLSGSTQGANPAMAQMMSALTNAQNRFIDQQRADKASKLSKRTALLGDAKAAEASVRMQLGKVFDDHAKTVAKQFGLDALPPAVSTAGAQMRVKGTEEAAKVQMFVESRTEQRHAVERKPSATRAPTNQAEAQLSTILGQDYAKKHAEATDPKGTNLPGILTGAKRAEEIKAKLDKLAKDNGGTLPGEGVTGDLGASTSAKVFGDQASKNILEAKSLKEELKLAFKQSSTTSKYFDSEKEGQGLNDILNTGNWETSSKAIQSYAQRARQAAMSIADGVAPGRGAAYLKYLEGAAGGPRAGAAAGGIRETVVRPAPAGAPAEPPTAPTGGGPAPSSPLAQSPSASAPGSPTAAPENEEPVNLKTLQGLKSDAAAAGKNGDAITRVVRFEFGNGKPNASGATGLVQWMPDTFKGMDKPPGYENVTHADLKDLTPEEQVPLAVHYFKQFPELGPSSDVGDYYLAVAAPAALRGKWPDSKVVYPKSTDPKSAWQQNAAWRPADGGDITVGSIKARARRF